jgi:hypothetical protein
MFLFIGWEERHSPAAPSCLSVFFSNLRRIKGFSSLKLSDFSRFYHFCWAASLPWTTPELAGSVGDAGDVGTAGLAVSLSERRTDRGRNEVASKTEFSVRFLSISTTYIKVHSEPTVKIKQILQAFYKVQRSFLLTLLYSVNK